MISILSVRSVKSGVKIKTGDIRPSDQVVKGAAGGRGDAGKQQLKVGDEISDTAADYYTDASSAVETQFICLASLMGVVEALLQACTNIILHYLLATDP